MKLPPVEVILTWPTPNYVNPKDDTGAGLLIANCIMFFASAIVVSIRMYTRLFISRNFGWDDAFILIAFTWIVAVVALAAVTYKLFGGTRHVWDTVPTDFPGILKYTLANQILFGQAVGFTKVSMLLLTKRVMAQANKTIQYCIWAGIAYVVAGNISYTLVLIFQCTPVSAQFSLSFNSKCIDVGAHMVAASIINAISDFLVVLIPIPVVIRLKMRYQQRAVVLGLFATGFLICIVSIIRTIYTVILIAPGQYDYTWGSYPVYICSAVEMYLALICASIPPTRSFFTRYTPRLFSLTTNPHGSKTNKKMKTATSGHPRRIHSSEGDADGKRFPLAPISAHSDSSRSNHTCKAEYAHGQEREVPGKNEMKVIVVIDTPGRDSSASTEGFESSRTYKPKQWRTTPNIARGELTLLKLESQISLIKEKS